ncbi:MAG: HD domain-containing protein [Rhodospirillaceae bacterium]
MFAACRGGTGDLDLWQAALSRAWAPDWSQCATARCALLCAEEPWVAELLQAKAMRRLDRVAFLGGIDYSFRPNGRPGARRHSRLAHSLDVAFLAFLYGRAKGLDQGQRRLAIAATLMHDLGHTPLSHSLEPSFLKALGLDHQSLGEKVLADQGGRRGRLAQGLRQAGLGVDQVLGAMGWGAPDPLWLATPVNLDGIDGICRSASYVDPPGTHAPPILVLAALMAEGAVGQAVLDRFWALKDRIYRDVIFGPSGTTADKACQDYAATLPPRSLGLQVARSDDRQFLRAHPTLRQRLASGPRPADKLQPLPDRQDNAATQVPNLFVVDNDHALGDAGADAQAQKRRFRDLRRDHGLARIRAPALAGGLR